MCFYSVTDYQCGDWKWGSMRERCQRQQQHHHHYQQQQQQQQQGQPQQKQVMHPVCKVKLVHTETSNRVAKLCRTCEAIQVKRRREVKLQERMQWKRKNGGFQNSLARMEEEMADLLAEIDALEASRESRNSVRLASSSAVYAAAAVGAAAAAAAAAAAVTAATTTATAAGMRPTAPRLMSSGRAWEPSCDCQSPTAEMMSRLPIRW